MANESTHSEAEFRPGTHLWSNPRLRGTPAEIPVVLAAPTLYDVVELAQRYPLELLYQTNRRLRLHCEISERRYLRTNEILQKIEHVNASSASSEEGFVAEVAQSIGNVPTPCIEAATAEEQRRSLAAFLPAGLPTVVIDQLNYIYLFNVPFELESAVRRWLRRQDDDNSHDVPNLSADTPNGLALSATGWHAFLSWLTETLHHRLDLAEVGERVAALPRDKHISM